ncbi:rhodanese-like domain-containing protein [Undibacterium sp. Ji83W]|uniref:rhodanese-like domain-containing protein n=1 Tax=Undibacterium sp. Ji83W TaxID=3413043 RepID=UPI003BF3ECBD
MKISAVLTFYFCALGAVHAQDLWSGQIELGKSAQTGFEKYKEHKTKKAFAVAADGGWGSAYGQSSDVQAVRTALSNCLRHSKGNCKLYDVDNDAFQDRYAQFISQSELAIHNLKIQDGYQNFENGDWLLPPVKHMRPASEGYHYATPTSIEGIKNISTPELVEKLGKKQIALIDALGIDNSGMTLPFAVSLDGAANFVDDSQVKFNKNIEDDLHTVMTRNFPDKDAAIAVFCISEECWVSINTLLRLKDMGYSNLYWYRGGIAAWQGAKLPLVKAVPLLTVLR